MKKTLHLLMILLTLTCSLSTTMFAQQVTIKHQAYEIRLDTVLKEPIYTHYILTKSMLNGQNPRTTFHADSTIPKSWQSPAKDYANFFDMYDQGHLAPDDDFRSNAKWEKDAMLWDNRAPQISSFNRGLWLMLENYVRLKAEMYKVEIWTGCIYAGSNTYVGSSKVPVFYWKVLKYNGTIEAYKMPNVIPKSKNLNDYRVDYKTLINFTTNNLPLTN